jgi:hypothetical protein
VKAAKLAAERDPTANRRKVETLRVAIELGREVDVWLDAPALAIRSAAQTFTWNGGPESVGWPVSFPANFNEAAIGGVVHVALDGVPVGEIEFTIGVERVAAAAGRRTAFVSSSGDLEAEMLGDRQLRYRSAFVSYSRVDFEKVSFFAEGLEENGIRLFADVTSLEPGSDWQTELRRGIDGADVFYLMWSNDAAASTWVDRECRHADERSRSSADRCPRMKPITLHREAPQPPEYLRHLHFDSKWLAHREAHKKALFVS